MFGSKIEKFSYIEQLAEKLAGLGGPIGVLSILR